jgi:histidinol phosphatase-like enzyme
MVKHPVIFDRGGTLIDDAEYIRLLSEVSFHPYTFLKLSKHYRSIFFLSFLSNTYGIDL